MAEQLIHGLVAFAMLMVFAAAVWWLTKDEQRLQDDTHKQAEHDRHASGSREPVFCKQVMAVKRHVWHDDRGPCLRVDVVGPHHPLLSVELVITSTDPKALMDVKLGQIYELQLLEVGDGT